MVEIHTRPGQDVYETVKLSIDDPDLDFNIARERAKARAREINRNAMQLAWYNSQTGKGYPDYDCGAGIRSAPCWQVFADSRGANLMIDVNDGTYLFMFITM
jgi:hypothetical protein